HVLAKRLLLPKSRSGRSGELFWRWKSRPRGRPRVPADLQRPIAEIATRITRGERRVDCCPTAGEARHSCVALALRRYLPTSRPPRAGAPSQRWNVVRPESRER